MTSPKVSICVPAYRQVHYLEKTLLSIQEQTFKDYELIITDDSPDNAVAELLRTFNFDGKLRYYHNPVALGSPENWNEAIRHATGDYIKIMHHDDRFSHPGSLAEFVNLLSQNAHADLAFAASLVECASGGKTLVHRLNKKQIANLSIAPERLFLGNLVGAPSATIYKRTLNIEYDARMQWLVDIDFYIQVLRANPNFVYSPEALVVTTSNAAHQVTEVCRNNIEIDFGEHALLYHKIISEGLPSLDLRPEWFRLFEKYQVYSMFDLTKIGVSLALLEKMMPPIFDAYKSVRLMRFPRRITARLRDFHALLQRSINV